MSASAVTELADLGVTQIAAAVRAGRLTAEEIATAALARIERLDNRYNCFTRIDVEDALKAARKTDRAIRRGDDPGPLPGVTFGAKDLFDVAGETTTAGARLRAHAAPAEEDAAAVSSLRRAGGTLLGSQNMDEFAYGFTTENEHTGATCNPHDVTRIAGGSSGGSAASVAAGLSAAAIGSDTNGSVRVPAAFCGVFGLKPTFGRISRRGVFPFVHSLDHVGGFARSAADLAALYDVLQGRDARDHGQADRDAEPALPGINSPDRKLRVAELGGYFHESASSEVLEALGAVADAFGKTATVELLEVERARSAAFVLSAAEGGSLHLDDLKKRPQFYDHAVRDRLIAGAMMPAGLVMRAQRFRRWFRDAVAQVFRDYDVLLAPATPFAAQPIGQKTIRMARGELSVRANAGLYTQPISFIGLPVVTVPLTGPGKLPLGVQMIGAPWAEARLLRAARRLEKDGVVKARIPTEARGMKISDPAVVAEVTAKFHAYETALMTDDIEAMGELFWDSSNTVRLGVGENLYGIEEINAFRIARRGSPQRDLLRVEITTFGDNFAVANAEFRRHGSEKAGRQSQAWARIPDRGWRVVSAHVSIMGNTS